MVHKTLKQLPKTHKTLLAVALLCVVTLMLLPSEPASASRQLPVTELELGKRYPLDLNVSPQNDIIVGEEDGDAWQTHTIRKGDNLAKIFQRAGFTPQDTYRVSRAGDDAKALLKMRPGQELMLASSPDGQFKGLRYRMDAVTSLKVSVDEDGSLQSNIEKKTIETRLNYAQGQIDSSFWNAGVQANLSDNQIMSLANIFGWDIDFALEIRQGDTFNVIFEEQYIEGDFVGYGNIVAAEFVNQGEIFTAVRYDDGNYYTPEGRSMRKSFLRAPVNFKYISSSFKKRRFHPVQKRWKAHRGVDYAADRGTPVMAAGDGKVIRATYDKYNGHHVFIQHGEKYTTKYLHFTKRAVKRGDVVKQGQVIGYVGSTGLASGPHLHYEFLVDGVHRNPRTVSLPKAQPIDQSQLSQFKQLAALRLEQLSNNKRIMLAMN
ncbi:peptidoglycan DD-metalloendopeptidase family protein [Aestuariibacter halophilus]|uniref:Peptidoglycan DD-metalloendopeptidase family protein n=1 Tax=Fluctibacter halophilus TaxID=226011 RepID=A0ABS8GA38_9ALTE|nr:peptidoglycan DD-metalloendopeptidase family protein [Aestuariibacter halophilus]MCC2617444.1 peptidoglycan DD-metalloendopeptidase family protein [Aestuariibacter halophilus]